MDLTTKNKPFYFESDDNNELTTLSNERNYKKIPDKINNIIMNLLLISNMILKESTYLKNVLNKLKSKVYENKKTLSSIKSDIPEKESSLNLNGFSNFLNLLINPSEEKEKMQTIQIQDKKKEKINQSLNEIESNKSLLDTLSVNKLRDESNSNSGDYSEGSDDGDDDEDSDGGDEDSDEDNDAAEDDATGDDAAEDDATEDDADEEDDVDEKYLSGGGSRSGNFRLNFFD